MRLDDLVGQQVDDFLVQERIGKGGMATVFRAYQPNVNRDIALKVIDLSDEQPHAEENFRHRFAHEAEIIASLEHPYIVPVYDYGLEDELAFLAMRLLKGGSLADVMRDKILPLERTIELFGQIARGLSFAHGRGIIHRDLKPSNILLDDEGNACLTDFGLAKLISGGSDITKTGNIVGTPAYMSPEQLRGDSLDHRSDIYSLGVILYQMLTGRPPFEGGSTDVISVIYKHLEKLPDLPSKHNPHLNSELDAVVMKSLAKKPDERYDNAGDMLNALRVAAGFKPSTGSFPVATVPRVTHEVPQVKKRNEQRTLLGAALVALVLAVILAAVIFATRDSGAKVLLPPTVLPDRRVNAANIIVTDEEIAFANQNLGDEGFVALITCNRTSQYHAGITREIVEDAERYGLRVQIYDADNSPNRQVTLNEQARGDGALGIIICPLDLSI
ncbi:MAG: protein kinase, partial [Chitinophagaceae bacterium]|nr:protein kinase [Anaerolineae bacterium]